MMKSIPLALLAGASLLPGAVMAQAPRQPTAAKRTVATTRTTTRTTRTTTARPRTVTARLANGRTVTYNCSLPGNASKQACK